ncbi:MAG: tautomerase family protein [Desulfobacterales bacterium]|nr:tautomerase family protein [Desulfobacterales bacterium]
MPFINLQTSVEINNEDRIKLLSDLTKIVAKDFETEEEYVMAFFLNGTVMMGGKIEDAALVDISCVGGLNHETNNKLSKHISSLLQERLNILPDNIYLLFSDVPEVNWGWKGKTCD